jgi:glycosyltransferase involved in cell wall biosynthesis
VRAQILDARLLDAEKLVKVPLGVADAYTSEPDPLSPDNALSNELGGRPFVIHVGSAIPRKRLDTLFDVFAGLRRAFPDLVMVKVGGEFTAAQRARVERLNLAHALIHTEFMESRAIAGLYRRAAALLQPSDAEGFGLPVLEALACGCRVVASAIPSLLEVGGKAATYCSVGAVDEWVHTVERILNETDTPPQRAARLAQAAKYSWHAYAAAIVDAYRRRVVK